MARDVEPGMPRQKKGTAGSGKWSDYKPNAPKEVLSWSKVDEAAILVALSNVTGAGAALLFAVTRDGGALVVTLCDGDQRYKLYANNVDEMGVHLRELADRS